MNDRPPLLAARAAGKRFGSQLALAPTDFELSGGEAVALVGPNGAGKSTLLGLLAGAIEPTSGTVERRAGARIGWAPQRPAQYARLSPRENLELFARLDGGARPEQARALLGEFELPDGDVLAGDLSVGNRQRLNLAIALLGTPDALLLDEPTAALDPEQRRRLWDRLEAQRKSAGVALLFVTQHGDEVERHADRVVALREGAVDFAGPAAEYVAA